jgi:putative heme degradation protein
VTQIATLPDRAFLSGDAATGLSRLASAGRIMAVLSAPGALLERIGPLNSVTIEDGWLCLNGAAHNARLRLDALAAVVVDRTPRMRDKPMPRVELQAADGTALMTLHALDGGEGLDAALGPMMGDQAPPRILLEPAAPRAPQQAGAELLDMLQAACVEAEILLTTPHATQRYRGTLPALRAMGEHQNLIQSDFHLHLADSAVLRWRRQALPDGGMRLHAEAGDGSLLGLTITLSALAVAQLPLEAMDAVDG